MGKYSIRNDPRGLIYEAYKIEGITEKDCRSIFFDWAVGLGSELNPVQEVSILYDTYALDNPGHPMNGVLKEGLSNFKQPSRRRKRKI